MAMAAISYHATSYSHFFIENGMKKGSCIMPYYGSQQAKETTYLWKYVENKLDLQRSSIKYFNFYFNLLWEILEKIFSN